MSADEFMKWCIANNATCSWKLQSDKSVYMFVDAMGFSASGPDYASAVASLRASVAIRIKQLSGV